MSKYISPFKGATRKKAEEPKKFINAYSRPKAKNQGGIVGGAGYLAGNLALGAASVGEGIVDIGMAGADLLRGDTDMAQYRFLKSVTGEAQQSLQESYNPNGVMQFAGDVASGMGTSLVFMIPYAGPVVAGAGFVGQGISNAAQKTGEVGLKEIGYGLASGGLEFGLEAATAGLGSAAKNIGKSVIKTAGKEAAEATTKAAIKATGKSVAQLATKGVSKSMLSAVVKETAKGMAGEAIEESAAEAIDPFLLRLFNIDPNAQFDLGNVIYAGVVGAMSGGLMTAGPAAINYESARRAGQGIRESGETADLLASAKALIKGAERAKTTATEAAKAKATGKKGIQQAVGFAQGTKDRGAAKNAGKLAETLQKNVEAYEAMLNSENVTEDTIRKYDALLGELRGNAYLLRTAYIAETYEAMVLEQDEATKAKIVEEANTKLAAKGAKRSNYTVADLDADTDGLLSMVVGEIMQKDALEALVGQRASASAEEATTSPWEGLADNEDMSGYNAAGEAENALLKAAVRESVPRGSVQAMLDEYRKGTDMTPDEFASAWSDGVHIYGRYGINPDTAADSVYNRLPQSAKDAATRIGHETAEAEVKERDEAAKKKKNPAPKPEGKEKREGRVVKGEGLNVQKLSDEQYAAYKAAEILAQNLGTDIVIETSIADTAGRTTNGYYDRKTNTIHININAMRNGKNVAVYTLAHEVTHYIKEWSPAKFKTLSDFVMDKLGGDAETLIDNKLALLRKIPDYKDYTVAEMTDLAAEEVVADGMEMVLTDGSVLEKLAQTDKTLWEKIRNWIFDIIGQIRRSYEGLNKVSKTAQVLAETMETFDEIERMFEEGVKEAGERARTAGVVTGMNEKNMQVKTNLIFSRDGYSADKIESRIANNKKKVLKMSSVSTVAGTEFAKGEIDLVTQVTKYFESINNACENEEIGTVKLTRTGAKSDIAHGIGRKKAASFSAVPDVISKGKIVDYQRNWKNRGYDTAVVVAPITISGDEYLMGCVVIRAKEDNIFYLHEVAQIEKDGTSSFKTGSSNKSNPSEDAPSVMSILQNLISVNRKYSISKENSSDTAYLSAVERGDMETAQKMVDEAAKKAGYSFKAKHYTDAKFTVFDPEKIGSSQDDGYFGRGFYFTSLRNFGRGFGSNRMDVYLRAQNPLIISELNRGERQELYDYVTTRSSEGMLEEGYEIRETDGETVVYNPSFDEEFGFDRFTDDGLHHGYFGTVFSQAITDWAQSNGYDAIFSEKPSESGGVREIVLFSNRRVKSADPVTYDDNGNVIPLSERFNEANPDIRYSLGEDSGTAAESPDVYENRDLTDRDMLLDMAEQMVGNEAEFKIVSDYKAQFDTISAKQNRINELTTRQRELQSILFSGDSDAKARSDASKELRTIHNEMNALLEDVAKADRKLTEIEGMKVIRNLIQRERLAARDTFKKKYETMYKRKTEASDTANTRRSVRRLYNRVNRLLFAPTKTRNVPIGMQGIVAEALRAANVDTEAIERLGQLEEQLAALERDPAPDTAKMAELEERIEEQERRVGKVKDQVNMLIEIFEATNDRDADGETRLVFDDAVLQKLKELRKDIGNASIRNMDRNQLLALKDFYGMIWHRIKTANNTLASNRKMEINKLGEQASREVRDGKTLKILSPKAMELVGAKAARKYIWSNLKPLTAFEAIGSDSFMNLFREVLKGEDTWARDLEEAYNAIKASKDKHGYDDWNMIERKTVKTADGDVELSLSEIMSLYAYSFREQAISHLMGGGFVLDPNATARVKGKKLSFVELERRLNNPTRYTLTEAQIRTLGNYLTEAQRAYVEEVQQYLTNMGEKGNEVSRKLYGIDIFREKHYFPIKVKSEYLESQTGKTGDPKIKNRGMTKEIVPEAKNPLVLQDFMAVAGDHINSMATYHAFVLPVEDLTRVLNFKPTNVKLDKDGNPILDENGMPVADDNAAVKYDTLKSEIEAKYGAEAVHYIEQMIRDLNGGARRDAAATLLDQGLMAFKRSATMMSLSTVIQQPTSIFRAMAYVDAKWFTGAKMYDYETIKKYAPVAIMKEIGGFDTGTGMRTAEYLNSKEYKTFQEKLKAIALPESKGGDPAYRAEAFGWLTGKADEITWRYMFGAIVNEQADKLGKPADSEAVLEAAGERFADVVRRTQVYDSTLTRSEYMRSKDTGAKLLTQFAAEPTTVVSMIVDGLIKAERGDKAFFRKTAAAVATSIIINAMASSLIYAMRDDDEDKNFIEKYISSLTGEIIEGFNPLEYLPFFRDIMSIFKGYDVERSDMTLVGNLFDQIELITSSKRSFADKLFGVTGAVTAFFGIPVTNVYRDAKGMIKTSLSLFDAEPVTGRGIGGAVNEGVKSQYNLIYKVLGIESGNAYELYKAAVSGDTAHYDRVRARYASKSAAEQALRKELRENDRRIAEAAEAKASGELDVYESIIDKIEAEGHFDRNLIIRAINNEVLELKDATNQATATKDEASETDDEEGETSEALYTATDLTDAMERGDTADFADVYDYLIAYKVEQGKTEAQAKSSIKSSVTAKYKRLYLAAWEANNTAEMKRILALLEQTGLYGSYNDTAKTVEKWVRESAK